MPFIDRHIPFAPEVELNALQALSARLKAYQHKLIDEAAASSQTPPDSVIAKISALENSIVAVETLIAERSPDEK